MQLVLLKNLHYLQLSRHFLVGVVTHLFQSLLEVMVEAGPFRLLGIFEIPGFGQLFPQPSYLLPQMVKIFSQILIEFDSGFEYFGPFGEHECGKGVTVVLLGAVDVS